MDLKRLWALEDENYRLKQRHAKLSLNHEAEGIVDTKR